MNLRMQLSSLFPLGMASRCGVWGGEGGAGEIPVEARRVWGRASFFLGRTSLPVHPRETCCVAWPFGFLSLGWQTGWRSPSGQVLVG